MDRINNPDYIRAKNIHEFTVRNLKGELIKLDKYKGFVCVIVNVGSKCHFTVQNYKHFNILMDKFGDRLRILAFPCDQFGEDPGTPEEIASHAEENNVKFDLYAKVDVNGEEASDVWKYLKHSLTSTTKHGNMIKSICTKFIVNKVGIPVERLGPEVHPADLEKLLERESLSNADIGMDPDEVTRQLAILFKRKYKKRRRHNYLRGSSNVISSFLNGAFLEIDQALASVHLRKRTILLSRPQADSQQNTIQRQKRKESRF